jgi:ribose 5-phosphate isomerase B
MKIALASDHGGYHLKEIIKAHLQTSGHEIEDFGVYEEARVDYPEYACQVIQSILGAKCERGILVCGTGIGMSIMANRFPGIRAALVNEHYSARLSREHNDSNVLCLGGRVIGSELAVDLVEIWLKTPFLGARHQKRLELIDQLACSRE